MSDGVKLSMGAARKVAALVKRDEQKGLAPFVSQMPGFYASENGPFIGIAQEDIAANTSGPFKFAYGAKGSETAKGNEYQGYYRTSSDAGDIPEGAYVYVVWINDGWELTPVECPE